jgi:hypothetical protein
MVVAIGRVDILVLDWFRGPAICGQLTVCSGDIGIATHAAAAPVASSSTDVKAFIPAFSM